MQPRNDQELFRGLKNESSWAFECLYSDYFKMISSQVLNNNGSLEDTKDHFQDVIIALIKSISKPDFELAPNTKLSTYLYAISNNIWLMKLKTKKLNPTNSIEQMNWFDISDDISIRENKEIIEEKHKRIGNAFGNLGEDCHKLLDLYYFKNYRLTDIAVIMEYTKGFVRVKKNRCMNELRKHVENLKAYSN